MTSYVQMYSSEVQNVLTLCIKSGTCACDVIIYALSYRKLGGWICQIGEKFGNLYVSYYSIYTKQCLTDPVTFHNSF